MHGFNLGLLGTSYIPLIVGGVVAYGIYCVWAVLYFIPKMKEHDDDIPPEVVCYTLLRVVLRAHIWCLASADCLHRCLCLGHLRECLSVDLVVLPDL